MTRNRATDHARVMEYVTPRKQEEMETATQINHELITSLKIARGYRHENLNSLDAFFSERKRLAEFILDNGIDEQSQQAYDYINSQILIALGVYKP